MRRPQATHCSLVLLLTFYGMAGAQPAAFSPSPALMDVPVTSMMIVDPAEYEAAAALVTGSSTPLEVALTITAPFEGTAQHILQ